MYFIHETTTKQCGKAASFKIFYLIKIKNIKTNSEKCTLHHKTAPKITNNKPKIF